MPNYPSLIIYQENVPIYFHISSLLNPIEPIFILFGDSAEFFLKLLFESGRFMFP